jgi:hypothetical protein
MHEMAQEHLDFMEKMMREAQLRVAETAAE